jgi:hypothetical protein
MRLHDRVSASTKPVHVALPDRRTFLLPSAAAIAAEVRNTPVRYVLDDDVAALAMRIALGDAARLIDCLDLVRIGAPLLWLEWNERGSLRAMAELGIREPASEARSARVGLLVRSDPTGRRGDFSIVWEGEAPEPDLSPLRVKFDLDDSTFANHESGGREGRRVVIKESEPLTRLLAHARFCLAKEWDVYFGVACSDASKREEAWLQNLNMATADFPFLVAFCLLISAKSAFALRPKSFDRLNAARARSRKPPLLDHIEVSARIDRPASTGDEGRDPVGRAPSRLHLVCGHLVRRGARVFWRRAHLRGAADRGVIASRTISLRNRRPEAAGEP